MGKPGETHGPKPQDRVLGSGLGIQWAGRRCGRGAGRGLTHVQRRKSGSSTWSHRPSPSWQHSSARGLMGSPTARASTPRVSVGTRARLVLGSNHEPDGYKAKTWGTEDGSWGLTEQSHWFLGTVGRVPPWMGRYLCWPGGDPHEPLGPSPALGAPPEPLMHPGFGSAQAGGPRGLSAGIPAGDP